ncbi:MAG: serine/threonine protein kinase [Defluviitaleaceae bacterium]|nr:serine/threonine protein kinase [Defluviitaleaceae bacterium]
MGGTAEYILSKYKEIEIIAETGKSKIFLVKDNVSGHLLVKKQLPLDSDTTVYKKLSAKDIKGLPRVHFVVSDDRYNYVFEDYISGSNLMNMLGNEKSFTPKQVIEWALMLCDVLDALHGYDPQIIHRDIKPSNIIISDDGILKLIDFDIAREYKADAGADTAYIGTKKYASPEQYGFSQTDCRSDIFSVGILMAELLTGNTPNHNQDLNPYGALGKIIKKCIEVDPKQRFQNVGELQLALRKVNRPFYNRAVVKVRIVTFICATIGIF